MTQFSHTQKELDSDSAKAILVCIHLSQLNIDNIFLVKIQPEYINIHIALFFYEYQMM